MARNAYSGMPTGPIGTTGEPPSHGHRRRGLLNRGLVLYADTGPLPVPVRGGDIERTAWYYYNIAARASSVAQFARDVEMAGDLLVLLLADAVVFSLSGGGGNVLGAGFGFEILYGPRFGWHLFFQVGGGITSPGVGATFEVGLVWNVHTPADYEGWFIGIKADVQPDPQVPVVVGVAGFASPETVADYITGRVVDHPYGFKVGAGLGSQSGSLFLQYYWDLWDITDGSGRRQPSFSGVVGPIHGIVRATSPGYIETTEEYVRFDPRTGSVISRHAVR